MHGMDVRFEDFWNINVDNMYDRYNNSSYGSASFISLLNLSIHRCFVSFQSTCGLG